ncbi:MAG: ribokinase [Ruminococcaceae bacterium]|nr:ribokinase [Oscillospiraceae bacterium]
MRVLCFGSLNIDYVYQVPCFVRKGETLAATELQSFSGGKGLNQSVALARAGIKTFHAGAIGEDGAFLAEELRAAGVDTSFVACLHDVRTGHAVIQKTPEGDNCILLYGGANRAVTHEQIDRTLAHFSAPDVLVAQNEISEPGYLLERAKARGMRIALNPSPMDETLRPLLPLSDFLLLNEIEASQLLGCDAHADPGDMAEELRKSLPATAIVLTLGENGSIYAARDGMIRCPAERVTAVDTTAAGDTYTGFFLAGILNGFDAARAMRFASAAAAIAVTRPGAAPSIPTRDEVLARVDA